MTDLLGVDRHDSPAKIRLDRRQLIVGVGVALGLAAAIALAPHVAAITAIAVSTVIYAAVAIFKVSLIRQGVRLSRDQQPSPIWTEDEIDLPRYTVLVPLFHEGNVVFPLVLHLSRMNYPTTHYEVLLLCEQEDTDTLAAVRSIVLPDHVKLVVCPDGAPRTKPRACNVGLQQATGELCVIYDTEDRPDRDQLRKAAAAFAASSDDVFCLQAPLDYHNHDTNWLARFFTVEYNFWFDLLLPALAQRDLPIPLGGTSNHFRTAMLRDIGGWDPYNVTEDADLGLRIYAAGGRTRMLDSVTMEEACALPMPWIRQRTRWVKGYLQTWLVHTRTSALRDAGGWRARMGLHMLVGGTPLVNVLNPLFWALLVFFAITRAHWVLGLFPRWLMYANVASLVVGNILFCYSNLIAVAHRERWHLGRAALLSPLYWLMMSAATWRAVWQLLFRPHVWEKTPHGLSGGDTDPAGTSPVAYPAPPRRARQPSRQPRPVLEELTSRAALPEGDQA